MCSFCCLENSFQHKWSLKLNTWGLGGKKEQRTERYKSDWTEHCSRARCGQAKPEWTSPAWTSEARSFLCEAHTDRTESRSWAESSDDVVGTAVQCRGGACGEDAVQERRERLSPDLQTAVPLNLVSGNFLPILCPQETSSTIPLLG